MRIYGIKRKADNKLMFTTASRTIAFHRFKNFYNRDNFRLVIVERD